MTATVLQHIVQTLRKVGSAAGPDQTRPDAVLWPDRDRQFASMIHRLREEVPILTLGSYDPACLTGPAIWILCALAGTVAAGGLSGDRGAPIVYLPGCSREDIRDIAGSPDELRPLADLQFRGVLWTQKNNRDWTAAALLENEVSGLGLRLARDQATREALRRALPRLLDEPVDHLRGEGELTASFFDGLLTPDDVRSVLLWLNDPEGARIGLDETEWQAFVSTCRKKYGFDPESDGPLTAALRLGSRRGAWEKVWTRFVEAPERYPRLPDLLKAAQPATLSDEHPDSWPWHNELAEDALRGALASLAGVSASEAAEKVCALEAAHGVRRGWVWARLGMAPLARALDHLVRLADAVERPVGGVTPQEIGELYAREGWMTDRAAMDALASVETTADLTAVAAAVDALYRGWLDQGARALQEAFDRSPPTVSDPSATPPAGTCLLFVDGLRFDIAQVVREALASEARVTVEWTISAIPTVTATAKPAVSPVAGRLTPGPNLSPAAKPGGPALSADAFRKALEEAGWQDLGSGSMGDPSGRAWAEGGDIDKLGHNLPGKLARRIQAEVDQVAERILSLLEWGWKRVVVVTDHGWLYLPGGLPKVGLPIHVAEVRKGRCARVKEGAVVEHQTLPWRWDPQVRIAIAPGISCYEAGRQYEHGGVSPQECVTPRITVEAKEPAPKVGLAIIRVVRWVGLRCRVEVEGSLADARVDLRTKPADPTTSIASEPKALEEGRAAVVVPDDRLEGEAAVVVVLSKKGDVLAQRATIVAGGDE